MTPQHYIERYWRDATPQDAIREPPMVARFQDNDYGFWVIGELIYWDRSEVPWYREEDVGYECCQVYDAPDPGEGWRLIDPITEPLQEGDEFMVSFDRESGWVEVQVRPNGWTEMCFYRRRIEQPKPEPRYEPFRWEDREQLRGRWYTMTLSSGEIRECQIEFLRLDRNVFCIGSYTSEQLLERNARFLDTGEPVGKRIEQ